SQVLAGIDGRAARGQMKVSRRSVHEPRIYRERARLDEAPTGVVDRAAAGHDISGEDNVHEIGAGVNDHVRPWLAKDVVLDRVIPVVAGPKHNEASAPVGVPSIEGVVDDADAVEAAVPNLDGPSMLHPLK